MADFEMAQGTEGIVANAKQEAFNLQNEAAFNNPVDLSIAAYTPSITKESMANAFKDNEDWRSFLADEKRYIKKDAPHSYKAFRQIEDMWRKPEFASIVDMYGTDMAVAGQMLSDYVDWDKVPWWEKQKIGIRAARYGMKINDARNDVIQAEHDGADPAVIAAKKQRVAELEEYFQHNARPYDSDTANAFASFGVSFARVVPEMALTSAAIAAIVPSGGATAGAAAVGAGRIAALLSGAGRAANIARGLRIARQAPKIAKGINLAREGVQGLASAGIVYNDTYRVTMGEVYDKLKAEHPEMPEEQLYEMSDTVSSLSAALEAAPAFLGLGARAASSAAIDTALRSVVTKVPQDVLQRAKFMRAFQEGVNKNIGKKIAAGWTLDAVNDTVTEVIQEAAENAALDIANGEGATDSILGETLLRMGGFLINPLDEKYASELNTLLTTLPAAALFGGIGPTVSYAGHRLSQRDSVGKTMSDLYRNSKFGSDLHAFTQANIDKMGAGAIKEMITGMGNRGDAPTSVYFDKAALQDLMDTDSEFRTSMERLGVLKQMEESEGNGGVIEVSLAEYNEIVNGDKSGVLYSKVKDMVTFQIDALTQSQFNEWLSSVETQNQAEIKAAIENEGSVYNRVLNEYLNQPMFEKMTDAQRKANASLMQLVANRAVQSMAKPMTAEEWFEQNVVLTQGTEEQAINGLQQTTEKTLDNANQPANIEAQGVTNGEQSAIRQIRRAIRQGNDSDVWVDTSTGDKTAGRVEGSRLLSFTDKAKQALASEGNAAPNFIVYENAEAGAQDFLNSMEAAVAKLGEFAASVDVKELSDYKNMKALILSEDKQTGCAVTQDGDIVSLFSCSAERRRTPAMLLMAVRQGGKKLDCFDIYLPKLYSEVGFKAVARNHWNEEYKPAGWNKTLFKGYNKGEPDVVFMVYDPTSQAIYQQGDGVLIEGEDAYDKGMAAQDTALQQIEAQDKLQSAQEALQGMRNTMFQRQYQKNKQVVAGWFEVVEGKYVVGLTDKWNATTFSHETFHLYSRVLQDNYNSGVMSSYWKAQTEKLFKTVDAKPNKKGQYKLTRNQEELLAERFTTYLLDNKIENPELNSIFALLRDAFDKTYKQLDMTKHTPDKKTKEAFAVIFGSQDVAVAEQRALGLLEIEKPANVSQEDYDKYMSFLLESRAKASHDMIKTYYRIEKYRKSKEYAEAYDAAYTANLQAAEREPFAQVKALAKELGTDDVSALLLAYNSTHGDAIITSDDVVAALNDPKTPTQIAEERTAEVMEDDIKEKFNTKEGDTLVAKDVRNAAMAKAFLMEAMMYEGKEAGVFQDEYSKLLADVDNQVQKMPLSKLQNNRRWQQLEAVYAQQYQMYMATGNQEKAAMVRRAQAQVVLIQNTMFEMNNRVDRFLTKFPKKLRSAQPANQNIMTAESWDLLQSLMEQYGFKIIDKRRSPDSFNIKLENWLKNIEASEYCPISNLRYFLPETRNGHQGSFGSMKVRQFEVLEHVANAINSVASREYNLITEDEKVKYDTLVALTAERFKEKGLKPFEKDDGWWRKHFGILSNIVNPEPIMKALFPEEVQQKLVRPLFSAASRAETDFNKWDAKWNEMIKKVNLSNAKKLYSTGHELSYNNVANLLLAMGNEHAYQNWRLFLKMDEAQAETVVAEALAEQPQLAEFANAYWAMMSETTELMNDSYRKRYNKLFVKKEPRAFKIGNYEFTGGYVSEAKLVSELREDAGWESILMGELSSEKLLNDTPDGRDLQSIVDNTRGRLRLFARWGHVAPAFNNFVRFVQREDVGAVIGSRAQNYIKGWLRDYHTPAGDSAGLMHALMAATTTTVLGVRLPQALLQLSGLIPAMGILGRGGLRYMVSALGRSLANGGANQVAYARSLPSDYMKARYADPTKTLFGVSKTEAHISQTVDKFQKFAMAGISYIDAIVANATWEASYRMARDNGLTHQEAIESADQNVRLSQTDALTISRSRAMKSDWARIITPFSTYMMGMQSVVRGRIAEKEFYGAFGFALSYIVGSTIFEAALKEIPMPWEDEDEKDYVERILERWYNDAISTAGSTLYPIAGLGSDAAKSFAWATEKILFPDEQTVIDMWGGGSLAALSYAKQYPDAMRYGLVGIFNGDEDAQRKAIANFVGWFSAGGKRMVKDMMED